MALPENFVQSLQVMPLREVIQIFTERPWQEQSTVELTNEVLPADLFCYLWARFGPPNGVQNMLRADHSDNLIHWDWTLRHDAGVIIFLGMNFRTDVNLFGVADADDNRADLVRQIKADFANQGGEMGKVRESLEQWTEFINPYQRVRRAVHRLRDALAKLDLHPERDREELRPTTQPEHLARWNELAKRYSEGLGLSFGIRSMLPVMAEAFVNLLMYVLLRPEIRSDKRLSDNAFRQPIDVRVKSLSINCVGFKQQPDYSHPACRAFHTLVNERNDLLHGNVVIDKLKFNDVYFWARVPVFKKYRTVWERSLQIEADAVGLEAVEAEWKVVNDFTDYLISCLDESIRERVEFMTQHHHLALQHPSEKVGVLFPEWLVDMRTGPRDSA
jgi:hypothetical protein